MRKFIRVISMLLCGIMTFSVCACRNDGTSNSGQQSGNSGNGEIGDIVQTGAQAVSYEPEDYIGDLETFVYGLLISKLEYIYDVFPAYVELSDSYFVYGLGYTDYSECYTNEDESVAYFMSGFLPFVGELEIPEEDFNSGLYLYNLDYQDEETNFVWKYKSAAFLDHCVVYGVYLQYGISEAGYITYEAIPFEREKCDTSLGSLYSYDESRYLYDLDFGNYLPISGVSLAEVFDYAEFEKEVNAFLEEQDANFVSYDVQTVAYTAQEGVMSYLLSLQEETFLGHPVAQLLEECQSLDPMECFRVTPSGISVIDVQATQPKEPTALCKWLVGSACAIVTAAGLVASVVFAECPPLSALAGAVTGMAIETFMQVIVENKTLDEVEWSKVCIAAASGAISGFIGPYLQVLGGAAYFFADSAIDGVIGGIEQAIFALMDGKRGKEVLSSFGYGFVLAAGLSAGFKVIGKGLSKVGGKLSELADEVADGMSPKLKKVVAVFVKPIKNLGNALGEGIDALKRKADGTIFHSKFIGKKMNQKVLANLTKAEADELFDLSFGKGTMKADRVMDVDGNYYTKQSLKEVWGKAKNGEVLGYIEEAGVKVPVTKYNSAVSISPQELYPTVTPVNKQYNKYVANDVRKENLNGSRELFREYFIKNSDKIPDSLSKAVKNMYPDDEVVDALKKMKQPSNLKKVLENGGALHENLDGTVTYMPKEVHKLSHMGGAALEQWAKQHVSKFYFEIFISAAANGAVVGGIHG